MYLVVEVQLKYTYGSFYSFILDSVCVCVCDDSDPNKYPCSDKLVFAKLNSGVIQELLSAVLS